MTPAYPTHFEFALQGSEGQLLTKISVTIMTIFVSFLVVGRHIVQSQCNTECKLWSEIFDLKVRVLRVIRGEQIQAARHFAL